MHTGVAFKLGASEIAIHCNLPVALRVLPDVIHRRDILHIPSCLTSARTVRNHQELQLHNQVGKGVQSHLQESMRMHRMEHGLCEPGLRLS